MLIVGTVSSRAEAQEIEFIAKCFVIGEHAKKLARQSKLATNVKRNIDSIMRE